MADIVPLRGRDAWVRHLQTRGLSAEAAGRVADTLSQENQGVRYSNGEEVTEGGVMVDITDGLSQDEATALGLEAERTTDRYIRQGWEADGEAGVETEEQGVNITETDELEAAYAAIARYADAHGITYEQAQRIYFESTGFSRQNLREQRETRQATHDSLLGQYEAWKAVDGHDQAGAFLTWVKETYGLDDNDPVIQNLQSYIYSEVEAGHTPDPAGLLAYLQLNFFASQFQGDSQDIQINANTAEENYGLGLTNAIPLRANIYRGDYAEAPTTAFLRNAQPAAADEPAGTEEPAEESETQQAEASTPPADDAAGTTAATGTTASTGATETTPPPDETAANPPADTTIPPDTTAGAGTPPGTTVATASTEQTGTTDALPTEGTEPSSTPPVPPPSGGETERAEGGTVAATTPTAEETPAETIDAETEATHLLTLAQGEMTPDEAGSTNPTQALRYYREALALLDPSSEMYEQAYNEYQAFLQSPRIYFGTEPLPLEIDPYNNPPLPPDLIGRQIDESVRADLAADRAIDVDPGDDIPFGTSVFAEAREAFRQGDYDRAIELYNEAFDYLPGGRPLLEIARCYIALGKMESARTILASLREQYPDFCVNPRYEQEIAALEEQVAPQENPPATTVAVTEPTTTTVTTTEPVVTTVATTEPEPAATTVPPAEDTPETLAPSPDTPIDITADIPALQEPTPTAIPAPLPPAPPEEPAAPANPRARAGETLARVLQTINEGQFAYISTAASDLPGGYEQSSIRDVLNDADTFLRGLDPQNVLEGQFRTEYLSLLQQLAAAMQTPDTADDQAVVAALQGLKSAYYTASNAEYSAGRGEYSEAVTAYERIENPPAFVTARLEELRGLRDTAATQQQQLTALRAQARQAYGDLMTYVSDNHLTDQDLNGNLRIAQAVAERLDSVTDPQQIQDFIDSLPAVRTLGEGVVARRGAQELAGTTDTSGTQVTPRNPRRDLGDIPTMQAILADPRVSPERSAGVLLGNWQRLADRLFQGVANAAAIRNGQTVMVSGYLEFNPSTGQVRLAEMNLEPSDYLTLDLDLNGDGTVENGVSLWEAVRQRGSAMRFTPNTAFSAGQNYQDVGGGWYRYSQRLTVVGQSGY
jgi:tetratricopeptide (TPR) repeat protein